MGIDAHGIRFLEYVFRANGPLKSTLTIGRQGLDVSESELRYYLGLAKSRDLPRSRYIDDLLLEGFGATSVSSIDASAYEEATYVWDLNRELATSFPQFDTVIDAGTLEHIFDVRTSFGNVARCCRIGGQILHILPSNNFVGHGFYQFSPEFFFSFYSEARGFLGTEVYLADLGKINAWWKVLPPTGTSRSTAMSSHETYTLVRTRKASEVAESQAVQQSDYVGRWTEHDEGAPVSSASFSRPTLVGNLSDKLPVGVRFVILSQLRERITQERRRFSSGMAYKKCRADAYKCPPTPEPAVALEGLCPRRWSLLPTPSGHCGRGRNR